ncbi:hypothetical protein DYI95_009810 [Thermaerobacter sp. PB12/4term]|uniref:hypothetical protein n=1 Tax=Thermaerobacter sp. PB12/4term TaxID=2293838 RepID=UPI000E325503|nr:hypothetical protein [Thermaerobacter sp. PB12/4term]QIA27765.1 hypothetical protein DYI95_009810 [Thermaerobacter sp. PB12/4term]
MSKTRRLTVLALASLAVALAMAGCGAQPQDPNDVQIIEDEEQVYIFPDGTRVTGDKARWTEQVVHRLMASASTWREADLNTAEFLQHVSIPAGFHLAKTATNGEVTRAIYVAPDAQRVFVLNAWHPGGPGRGWTITPNCVTETEAGQPIQPWLDHLCRAEYRVDGWQIQIDVATGDMESSRHLIVASVER